VSSPEVHKIEAFPADGQSWRLDYFGGVVKNPHAPTVHRIEVGLSQLRDPNKGALHPANARATRRCVRKVETGLLPYLSMGSVWRNGKPAIARPLGQSRFTIDPASGKVIDFRRKIKDPFGRDTWPVRRDRYWVGDTMNRGPLLAFQDSTTGDSHGILIPPMELIRFYFCINSLLAKELFWGRWKEIIWDKGCSWESNTDPRTYVVGTHEHIAHNSAFVLARYLLTAEMQKQCESIFSAIQLAHFPDPPEPAYFKTTFPFSEPTTLTAKCVSLPYDDEATNTRCERRLVLELVNCSQELPFDECEICPKDLNPRQGDIRTENLKEMHIPRAGESTNSESLAFPNDASEPSKALPVLSIVSPQDRFLALKGKRVELARKALQTHRHVPHRVDAPPASGLSTGDGHGQFSPNQRANIEITSLGSTTSSLDNFCAALALLRDELWGDWKLYSIPTTPCEGALHGFDLASLPRTMLGSNGEMRKSRWVQLNKFDKGHERRRRAVAAVIEDGDRYMYLIDFDAIQDEYYSAIVFRRPDLGEASAEINNVLQSIVNHRGWPIDMKTGREKGGLDLIMRPIHHHHHEKEIANVMKDRIETAIDSILGPPGLFNNAGGRLGK
jgi:hypothetical protein